MLAVKITRQDCLDDRQGRTFSDVINDPEQPFDTIIAFFNGDEQQRRMEYSEIHHDRPALAGVVRELESQSNIDNFFSTMPPRRTKRLRQMVGVVVRMIMERRGWRKTGRKGSLGVRAKGHERAATSTTHRNTGGLASWFLRAERYERVEGMPFQSARECAQEIVPFSPMPEVEVEKSGARTFGHHATGETREQGGSLPTLEGACHVGAKP